MNLNDAKKRIQAYLCSNKTWPLLVDVQTKSDKSEIIDYFKVGENTFPDIESFCNDDGDLKVDELYAAVSANVGNTFITNVTGFLKLHGELATKRALKTLATSGISGHVVVLTYQCKSYLKFSDPRIVENGTARQILCRLFVLLILPFQLRLPGAIRAYRKLGRSLKTAHKTLHTFRRWRLRTVSLSLFIISLS